jgi:hypothetical protein
MCRKWHELAQYCRIERRPVAKGPGLIVFSSKVLGRCRTTGMTCRRPAGRPIRCTTVRAPGISHEGREMCLDLVMLRLRLHLHLHLLESLISARPIQLLATVTLPLPNSVPTFPSVRVGSGSEAHLVRSGFRTILIDLPGIQASSVRGPASPITSLTITSRAAPATPNRATTPTRVVAPPIHPGTNLTNRRPTIPNPAPSAPGPDLPRPAPRLPRRPGRSPRRPSRRPSPSSHERMLLPAHSTRRSSTSRRLARRLWKCPRTGSSSIR